MNSMEQTSKIFVISHNNGNIKQSYIQYEKKSENNIDENTGTPGIGKQKDIDSLLSLCC